MPQDWGASEIQSVNSKIADCFFLPFHMLFPQSKAAAASHGLVLRQGWLLTAQGAEFQLCGTHPCPDPSDPLTAPGGSLLPCFHSYPRAGLQEGWTQAIIPESGQKLLPKVLCMSPVSPLKPAELWALAGWFQLWGLNKQEALETPNPLHLSSFAANFVASGT